MRSVERGVGEAVGGVIVPAVALANVREVGEVVNACEADALANVREVGVRSVARGIGAAVGPVCPSSHLPTREAGALANTRGPVHSPTHEASVPAVVRALLVLVGATEEGVDDLFAALLVLLLGLGLLDGKRGVLGAHKLVLAALGVVVVQ